MIIAITSVLSINSVSAKSTHQPVPKVGMAKTLLAIPLDPALLKVCFEKIQQDSSANDSRYMVVCKKLEIFN